MRISVKMSLPVEKRALLVPPLEELAEGVCSVLCVRLCSVCRSGFFLFARFLWCSRWARSAPTASSLLRGISVTHDVNVIDWWAIVRQGFCMEFGMLDSTACWASPQPPFSGIHIPTSSVCLAGALHSLVWCVANLAAAGNSLSLTPEWRQGCGLSMAALLHTVYTCTQTHTSCPTVCARKQEKISTKVENIEWSFSLSLSPPSHTQTHSLSLSPSPPLSPPLSTSVLEEGLKGNFSEVSVSVVECPDLSLPTWNLAAQGQLVPSPTHSSPAFLGKCPNFEWNIFNCQFHHHEEIKVTTTLITGNCHLSHLIRVITCDEGLNNRVQTFSPLGFMHHSPWPMC